jgi:hypothetical protein
VAGVAVFNEDWPDFTLEEFELVRGWSRTCTTSGGPNQESSNYARTVETTHKLKISDVECTDREFLICDLAWNCFYKQATQRALRGGPGAGFTAFLSNGAGPTRL